MATAMALEGQSMTVVKPVPRAANTTAPTTAPKMGGSRRPKASVRSYRCVGRRAM
jgi:hypothetical protein